MVLLAQGCMADKQPRETRSCFTGLVLRRQWNPLGRPLSLKNALVNIWGPEGGDDIRKRGLYEERRDSGLDWAAPDPDAQWPRTYHMLSSVRSSRVRPKESTYLSTLRLPSVSWAELKLDTTLVAIPRHLRTVE